MSEFNLNIKNNLLFEDQKIDFINKKNEILKNKIKIIGQYFICPKCNLNIPALPFFVNSIEMGSIEILINCKCGNKDRMPLEDCFNYKIPIPKINICEECKSNKPNLNCLYCINCSKWICEDCRYFFIDIEKEHNYSKYPIIFSELCDIHLNYENLFYCNTCKKEFCIKCIKFHPENHEIINLIQYYKKIKDLPFTNNFEKMIENVFKKNEELKKICLSMIEKLEETNEINENEENMENIENNNNDFKDINIEKEQFLELYNKNLRLNKQLYKFIHVLYNIFISANNHPNYNIIHNFELSSFINNDNYPIIEVENNNNININNYYNEQYQKIFKYFKENNILMIKSLILINEQKTYLDNINVKHLIKINDESFAFTSDTFFQIFNIKTKQLSPKANEHTKEITKIILLKNGKLVTGSKDKQIRIWNIGNNIMSDGLLADHDEEIIELIELSNGYLLSGDIHGKIIMWDINKYKQIQSFLLNSNLIGLFEINLNELFIVADKYYAIYHNNKKSIIQNCDNYKINYTLFINFISEDIINPIIISSSNDNFINIYKINPFKLIKSVYVNVNIITIKQFTNKYFYGISSEYTLHFFNLINYEQLFCINVKTYNFYEFLYMNDFFVYSGSNNGLTEWNTNFSSLIDDLVNNIVFV